MAVDSSSNRFVALRVFIIKFCLMVSFLVREMLNCLVTLLKKGYITCSC